MLATPTHETEETCDNALHPHIFDLDHVEIPIILIEQTGAIAAMNECGLAVLQVNDTSQARTDFVDRCVAPSDQRDVRETIRKVLERGEEDRSFKVRFRWRNRSGTENDASHRQSIDGGATPSTMEARMRAWDTDEGPFVVVSLIDRSKESELNQVVANISENERCRIGEDLHDLVASRITAISIRLQNLMSRIDKEEPDQLRQSLSPILDDVWSVSCDVPSLSHTLYPVEIADTSLAEALQNLVNTFDERHEPTFQYLGDPFEERPDDVETATHLYRIAYEALNNALHHANANHVWIDLSAAGDILELSIWDDGRGISNGTSSGGLGLHLMQCRADVIGAELKVMPAPRGGTLVRCLWQNRCTSNTDDGMRHTLN
ncbi:hypothetical protein CRI94_13060 [Longibacter salinarum]|uniref:histidine kinase n=1 Tax=Longibacter salinarum TaxID=1850348 RepID=A0A2A8CW99_9BACT|nr:ATP-binding protein [Longibacter salinarum]PEN12926.1 hypothetical protein CRI94_13060 [Longibacter salinarum]